jgi:anoctamin-7
MKNIHRTQPLVHVKNYFGEMFALYFAWVGTQVTTLLIPMIIGIILFIVGISLRLKLN